MFPFDHFSLVQLFLLIIAPSIKIIFRLYSFRCYCHCRLLVCLFGLFFFFFFLFSPSSIILITREVVNSHDFGCSMFFFTGFETDDNFVVSFIDFDLMACVNIIVHKLRANFVIVVTIVNWSFDVILKIGSILLFPFQFFIFSPLSFGFG